MSCGVSCKVLWLRRTPESCLRILSARCRRARHGCREWRMSPECHDALWEGASCGCHPTGLVESPRRPPRPVQGSRILAWRRRLKSRSRQLERDRRGSCRHAPPCSVCRPGTGPTTRVTSGVPFLKTVVDVGLPVLALFAKVVVGMELTAADFQRVACQPGDDPLTGSWTIPLSGGTRSWGPRLLAAGSVGSGKHLP